jgi:hypothetical protein
MSKPGSAAVVVASNAMSLWLVFALLAFVKIVMAAIMLWVPLRSDSAMSDMDEEDRPDSGDDEGGSKVLPGATEDPHPRRPLPHRPRRGPHGSPSPHAPVRVRVGRTHAVARTDSRR